MPDPPPGHHPRGMDATPALRPTTSARHASPANHLSTARGWTSSVLVVATLAAVAVGVRALGVLATLPLLAPTLLLGWCSGFAALALLLRRRSSGPVGAGLLAGALGSAVGAAALLLQRLA